VYYIGYRLYVSLCIYRRQGDEFEKKPRRSWNRIDAKSPAKDHRHQQQGTSRAIIAVDRFPLRTFSRTHVLQGGKRDRRRGPNLFIDLSIPAIASSFFFFFFLFSFVPFFSSSSLLLNCLTRLTSGHWFTRDAGPCARVMSDEWELSAVGGGSIADQAEEKPTKFA
jgi:hypothetical protein